MTKVVLCLSPTLTLQPVLVLRITQVFIALTVDLASVEIVCDNTCSNICNIHNRIEFLLSNYRPYVTAQIYLKFGEH
jgi:hypothetical protein